MRPHVSEDAYTRRKLPHLQVPGQPYHALFGTVGVALPDEARRVVLESCLFWNGAKCQVHACVVMPDRVQPTSRRSTAVAARVPHAWGTLSAGC